MMQSDEITIRIAGSIVMSENPAATLRSWRQKLNIKQATLAKKMKLSPSVLSDYEKGRRPSPGIAFIRRYVQALIELANMTRSIDLLNQQTLSNEPEPILVLGEYVAPVKASKVVDALGAEVLAGSDMLDWNVYGYTVLDSIRTIYALSGFGFYKIFGSTTERVLVFTKVGLGRSPLVAIRVSQLKPRMVILHGPKVVDPLAIELAKRERIILGLARSISESEIALKLQELNKTKPI